MRPRHQQLGGHDRPDAGLGQQRWPGGMLGDQSGQLGIELGGLLLKEPDPCGDRAQRRHRDTVLDFGRGPHVEFSVAMRMTRFSITTAVGGRSGRRRAG